MTAVEPRPADPVDDSPAADAASVSGILEACPYLRSADGPWRMAVPSRQHRCARRPNATPPSLEHQRAYCLAADHVACPAYGIGPAPDGDPHGRFLPPVPVILEHGSAPLRVPRADRRVIAPIAVAAIVVGLGAVVLLGGPFGGAAAPAPSPSPSPSPAASASASPSPLPSPSPMPSPSPAVSPSPSPRPSPTPTAPPVSTRSYTVKSGDTLYGIAQAYHTTVKAIAALNNLKPPYTIHRGQVLKLP